MKRYAATHKQVDVELKWVDLKIAERYLCSRDLDLIWSNLLVWLSPEVNEALTKHSMQTSETLRTNANLDLTCHQLRIQLPCHIWQHVVASPL
jgi:hypothetical protein